MSTLAIVEDVLRAATEPLGPKDIAARAGRRLPSRSRTPDTVIARDISRDIIKHGESSRFLRVARGLYVLRNGAGGRAAVVRERLEQRSRRVSG